MLTEVRWQKEQELMRSVFPQFKAFLNHPDFGFEGYLKGPKSGRLYRVVLQADSASYPQSPPNVGMSPRVGEHWIDHRGRRALCMTRNWQPARSTFANTLLALVKYLGEHDGESRSTTAYFRGNQADRLSDEE